MELNLEHEYLVITTIELLEEELEAYENQYNVDGNIYEEWVKKNELKFKSTEKYERVVKQWEEKDEKFLRGIENLKKDLDAVRGAWYEVRLHPLLKDPELNERFWKVLRNVMSRKYAETSLCDERFVKRKQESLRQESLKLHDKQISYLEQKKFNESSNSRENSVSSSGNLTDRTENQTFSDESEQIDMSKQAGATNQRSSKDEGENMNGSCEEMEENIKGSFVDMEENIKGFYEDMEENIKGFCEDMKENMNSSCEEMEVSDSEETKSNDYNKEIQKNSKQDYRMLSERINDTFDTTVNCRIMRDKIIPNLEKESLEKISAASSAINLQKKGTMQLDVEDLEYQVETCKYYLKQIDKWRRRVQFMGPSHFEVQFFNENIEDTIFLNKIEYYIFLDKEQEKIENLFSKLNHQIRRTNKAIRKVDADE